MKNDDVDKRIQEVLPVRSELIIKHETQSSSYMLEKAERAAKVLATFVVCTIVILSGVYLYFVMQQIIYFKAGVTDAILYTTSQFKNGMIYTANNAREYCPVIICGEKEATSDHVKKAHLTRIIQTVINNSTTLDTITKSKIKLNEVRLDLLSLKHPDMSQKAKDIRDTLGKMQIPVAVMDRIRVDTKNLLHKFKESAAEGKAVAGWTEVKSDIEEHVIGFANSCDSLKEYFKEAIDQVDNLLEDVTVVSADLADNVFCKYLKFGCSMANKLLSTKETLMYEYTTLELLSKQLIELKINAVGDAGATLFILPPPSHFKNDDEIIKLLDVSS